MKDSKIIIGFVIALLCVLIPIILSTFFGINLGQTILNDGIQVVTMLASFFGIYGIREQIAKYQVTPPTDLTNSGCFARKSSAISWFS